MHRPARRRVRCQLAQAGGMRAPSALDIPLVLDASK